MVRATDGDVSEEDLELLIDAEDLEEGEDSELVQEAAQASVLEAISVAAIEREFLSGVAGAEDSAAYLADMESFTTQAALDSAIDGESIGDGIDEEALSAAAEEMGVDAAEAEVTDVSAPSRGFEVEEPDVLEALSNEQAAAALETIRALKLSKDELSELVPADWDSTTVDWFTANRKGEEIPLPEYKLTFLWLEKNIAVAVDQVYARGQTSPLTEFFFWPRKDAWEELKAALEARPWINERDKVILLNRLTEVINFWQDETNKPSVDDARTAFPDCSFSGATA